MPKRDAQGRWVKGTDPPNPTGRPKDGESWSGILQVIGDMYTDDILEFIPKNNPLGKEIAKMPKNVQMKYLVGIRVYAQLMFDPSSGLLNALLDRLEGKVTQAIDMTTKGEKIGNDDTRNEILSKLDSIAAAQNAGTVSKEPE